MPEEVTELSNRYTLNVNGDKAQGAGAGAQLSSLGSGGGSLQTVPMSL